MQHQPPRTLVFNHHDEDDPTQVLVSVYEDGGIEVAEREGGGGSWGPPLTLIHEQQPDGRCSCPAGGPLVGHRFVSP